MADTEHAARVIQRWWVGHHNKIVFERLRDAVCQTEGRMASEVLRYLCPAEAEILKDPTMHAIVRFRFGGSDFPPDILYKVFLSNTAGYAVQQLSGKRVIQPGSEAAEAACKVMGPAKFMDLVARDAYEQAMHHVSDEFEATTVQEYRQLMAQQDNKPAWLGGRNNTWRSLTAARVPSTSCLSDMSELSRTGSVNAHLTRTLDLRNRPATREAQLAAARALHTVRQERAKQTSRRTGADKQARLAKMRQLYGLAEATPATPATDRCEAMPDVPTLQAAGAAGLEHQEASLDDLFEDDPELRQLEGEAGELYSWSQDLPLDDTLCSTGGRA
eukprot:m.152218 g.152218  ORF g.152218 m.152218 type:complete len:330 (-) comp17435_c0_seq4:26-1015(-)